MKTARLAFLVGLLSVGVALAQEGAPETQPPPQPPPAETPPPAEPMANPVPAPGTYGPTHGYYDRYGYYHESNPAAPHLITPMGMGVLIGGGVTQFFGTTATNNAKLGPDWTARVELGTRSY